MTNTRGRSRSTLFLLAIFFFLSFGYQDNLLSQIPELVRDINEFAAPVADPSPNFVISGNKIFFVGYTPETGYELWRSDGTAAGTYLLKDIWPGPQSSQISSIIAATLGTQNLVFFAADDGPTHGRELWKSDGTPAGTILVKDIESGGSSSSPSDIAWFPGGGSIFFSATTSAEGRELWGSAGETGNTVRIVDINPGNGSSNPSHFVQFGSSIYYAADDGVNGRELFETHALDQKTLIKNIRSGSSSSTPAQLVALPGVGIVFFADDGVHGNEPWFSNGAVGNGELLADIQPESLSSYPSNFHQAGSKVYFVANSPTAGQELWVTDGQAGAGHTEITRDINDGPGSSTPRNLTVANSKLFFTAEDGSGDRELWVVSDSLSARQVKDIFPGNISSNPQYLRAVGVTVLFTADDGIHGRELWQSSGSLASTSLAFDVQPGAEGSDSVAIGDLSSGLYFLATTDRTAFFSHSGPPGEFTRRVDLSITGSTRGSYPRGLVVFDNQLFFWASDLTHGYELWKTDGSAAGTLLVKDINPWRYSAIYSISAPVPSGGQLFFAADDGSGYGLELWKSTGTEAGTQLVKDIYPGATSSNPEWLTDLNGLLLFVAENDSYGREIWRSDGTAGGTRLLRDLNSHPGSSSGPRNLTRVGDKVFFAASTDAPTVGEELNVSDGTPEGTYLVKNINTTFGSGSMPNHFAELNGIALFAASDDSAGRELWRSDGTSTGTWRVSDIATGPTSSNPSGLIRLGDRVYFRATTTAYGTELWQTDGTDSGTTQVADINPVEDSGAIGEILLFNARQLLLFAANNGHNGVEPWVSDGSSAGTFMLADCVPGSSPSAVYNFIEIGGYVFFMVMDLEYSYLWRTDANDLWR